MAKAVHTMLRVLDEARAIDFYRRAFGLEIVDRFPFDDFTLIYLRGRESDFELELTVNHGRTAPYSWSTILVPSTRGSARKVCNPSRSRNSSVTDR